MDSDRKYRQRGYSDSPPSNNGNKDRSGDGYKPKPSGPRPSIDITGPRLPRLVQSVTASRCYSCSTTLPPGTDFTGKCPKCAASLHCCKQCSHFESSTRFQCNRPVPIRIAVKDQANDCTFFSPRVTVARDVSNAGLQNRPPMAGASEPQPRSAADARDAFARLFKI
ncbi:MAG: hypothetical protein JWN34_2468 [Bryobacterales bacterium]|nr:hypothetical protein [Bryobacterales bacterium]